MITYIYHNFGVHDVHGQIQRNKCQTSHLLPTDFPNNFLRARFHFNRKIANSTKTNIEVLLKKKKKSTPYPSEYIFKNILSEESVKLCFLVTISS